MKRTIVVIVALVAVFFLCRGGPARPTAERSAVRSARIELPRVAAQLRELTLADATGIDTAFVVRGVVESADGVPLAGARVAALNAGVDREEFAATIADGDGRYELVVREGDMLVEAEAPGFALDLAYLYATGVHEKRFQLVAAAALRGRIVRADGVACAAATMLVDVRTANQRRLLRTIVVDEAGAFSLDSMPPGDVELTAHGLGCVTGRPTELVLALGQTLDDIEVRAERGYAITGVVVDAGTQLPIAGVRMKSHQVVFDHRIAYTDERGRFVLHGFHPADVSVLANSPNFEGDATIVPISDRDVEVRIALAAVPPPEVPPPGKPVDVAITFADTSGVPVALTRVSLTLATGEVRTGSTDADGHVSFRDVPRGTTVQVHVEGRFTSEGYRLYEITIDTQIFRLVMRPTDPPPGAPIHGRVLDGDGNPAANVFIASRGQETVSRADGSFEVSTTSDTAYEITATSAHADLTATVKARPGETVTIRLERRFHVEVRATHNGVAVDNFKLGCEMRGGWVPYGATSLHAGSLRSLETGPVTCHVVADEGSGTGTIVVAHGAPNVLAIALTPSVTITGRIVSQTGTPLVKQYVDASGPNRYWSLAETDADGRFVIAMPAGAIELRNDNGSLHTLTASPGARADVGDLIVDIRPSDDDLSDDDDDPSEP